MFNKLTIAERMVSYENDSCKSEKLLTPYSIVFLTNKRFIIRSDKQHYILANMMMHKLHSWWLHVANE